MGAECADARALPHVCLAPCSGAQLILRAWSRDRMERGQGGANMATRDAVAIRNARRAHTHSRLRARTHIHTNTHRQDGLNDFFLSPSLSVSPSSSPAYLSPVLFLSFSALPVFITIPLALSVSRPLSLSRVFTVLLLLPRSLTPSRSHCPSRSVTFPSFSRSLHSLPFPCLPHSITFLLAL